MTKQTTPEQREAAFNKRSAQRAAAEDGLRHIDNETLKGHRRVGLAAGAIATAVTLAVAFGGGEKTSHLPNRFSVDESPAPLIQPNTSVEAHINSSRVAEPLAPVDQQGHLQMHQHGSGEAVAKQPTDALSIEAGQQLVSGADRANLPEPLSAAVASDLNSGGAYTGTTGGQAAG